MSTLVDTVDPRHAWMLFDQLSKYSNSNSMEIHPRMAWIHQIAEICQRWGGMGRQDRWRHGCRHRAPMDGFTACPACPCRPAIPRNASFCRCLGLKPLQVQGAALPKNTHKKNSRPRPAVSV
ncbi:hypothetical protein FEO89_08320 [Stenotrophomonas maltophilia]|nr:hypothetical protein FEO89_08320 [Stenotrophomonas maltophilia]